MSHLEKLADHVMERIAIIELSHTSNYKIRKTRDATDLNSAASSTSYSWLFFGMVLGALTACLVQTIITKHIAALHAFFHRQIIAAWAQSRKLAMVKSSE